MVWWGRPPGLRGSSRTRSSRAQARTLGRSAGVRVLFAVVAGTLLGQVSGWWRLALSVSLLALACALSWTAARALGRHLRIDASVDFTHELVRSGPYRLVRHPIYTSMLCVLLGTGVLISPLYLLLPAVLIFLIGTEIRMQVEDRMLVSRFGEQFTSYQHNVPGLIPGLKGPDGRPEPAASGAMARPHGPTNPEPEGLLGTRAHSLRTLRA